jgi:hypothetical protein
VSKKPIDGVRINAVHVVTQGDDDYEAFVRAQAEEGWAISPQGFSLMFGAKRRRRGQRANPYKYQEDLLAWIIHNVQERQRRAKRSGHRLSFRKALIEDIAANEACAPIDPKIEEYRRILAERGIESAAQKLAEGKRHAAALKQVNRFQMLLLRFRRNQAALKNPIEVDTVWVQLKSPGD